MIQRPAQRSRRRVGPPVLTGLVLVILAACQSTVVSTAAPSAATEPSTANPPATTTQSPAEPAVAGDLPPLADVPVYKATPSRTGVHPGPGPVHEPVEAWSTSIECLVGSHTPVLASGLLVASCDGPILTALDARTGGIRWTTDLGGQATDPVVADRVVFVGTTSGAFQALDLETGTRRWSVDIATDRLPMVAGGRVYVGTADGRYVGLDVTDGSVAWSWTSPLPGDVIQRGTVVDGTAYVTGTGMLYAVDITSGTTKWTYATSGQRFAAPTVAGDVLVVSSQPTGPIAVLDRETGSERWRFTSPSGEQVAPPTVANGTVFSPSADGNLYAFDLASGSVRWQIEGGPVGGQAAAATDDLVYFTVDRDVLAVDPASGAIRWKLDLGADADNGSLVSGGMLFTSDNSGRVRAFVDPAVAAGLPQPAASTTPEPETTPLPPRLELAATFDSSTAADLDQPSGIAVGPDGNVYVVNALRDEIVVLDPSDGSPVRRWGSTGSDTGQFNFRRDAADPGSAIGGVAVAADGTVFVADTVNRRVQAFTPEGTFLRAWGRFGPEDGQFLEPFDIAVGPDGDVYVVDDQRDDIQRFTADGTWVATIGQHGTGPGELNFTSGIAVGPDGTLYNADWDNHRAQAWDRTGTFLWTFGGRGTQPGRFTNPADVAVGDDGRTYVTDAGRIQVLDATPSVIGEYHLDGTDTTNVATGGGDVFLSEPFLDRILKLRVIR